MASYATAATALLTSSYVNRGERPHRHVQTLTNKVEPIDRGRARAAALRITLSMLNMGGSVAEWLACWTQVQKRPNSNRSRDPVG